MIIQTKLKFNVFFSRRYPQGSRMRGVFLDDDPQRLEHGLQQALLPDSGEGRHRLVQGSARGRKVLQSRSIREGNHGLHPRRVRLLQQEQGRRTKVAEC